ncbi:MAG: ATP-binding cassette domain-containing protein [Pseudonocardiaceae bacterium]
MLRGRPRLAEPLAAGLRESRGVQEAHANPVTGRLLIRHDPTLSAEQVTELVLGAVSRAVRLVTAPEPQGKRGQAMVATSPGRQHRHGRSRTPSLIVAGGSAAVLALALPTPLVSFGAVLVATGIVFRRAWRKSSRLRRDPQAPPASIQNPLLTIVGSHRRKFYLASILSVLGQVMDMLLLIFVGWIVLVLVQGESTLLMSLGLSNPNTQILFLAVAAGLVCLTVAALSYSAGMQWRSLAQAVRHEWRTKMYPHTQRLELRHLDDERTTRMARLLTDDINQLGSFLSSSANEVLQLATSFLILIPVFVILAPQIAWIAFLPVPIVTWLSFYYHDHVAPYYVAAGANESALNSQLMNNLAASATIKSFCAEDYEIERIRRLSAEYRDSNNRIDRSTTTYTETVRVCATVSLAGILLLGGRAVLGGRLRFEVFNPLVGLPQQVLWKLPRLGATVDQYQQTVSALQRVVHLRDLPVEPVAEGQRLDVQGVRGEMVLDAVTFAYPDRPPVLENLSLRIAPGQVTGIVGATGSGKTTIAKLLMRFQHADSGRVLLDGQDVRDLKLRDLRTAIGFVAQDAFLFDGTIGDNIRYGTFGADHERVVTASRLAAAEDFVEALPARYDTMIGERGVALSGGQKQRISLARAIVKSAPILVLDEATSAVDNETEAAIQSALKEFARDRTLVVIAHRLSTIRHADRIYVMDKGGVLAEEGTHQELLERDGVYASLWRLQIGEVDSPMR